jgi:hypothetical protein
MATAGMTTPFPFSGRSQLAKQSSNTWSYNTIQQQSIAVCTTAQYGQAGQPAVIVDKLLVFGSGIEMREHAMLIKWLGADSMVIFEETWPAHLYKEIVIMKMKLRSDFEVLAKNLISELLPKCLAKDGRIVNLNDPSEEQNEPQGPSEQTDAGEPDAS